MTIHRRRGYFDITREENFEYLEGKIAKAILWLPKEESSENHLIEMIALALCEHGKDENQMHHISKISVLLAQALGFEEEACETLGKAAYLYDIGNLVIDDSLYIKEENLSFEEFEVLKNHTFSGHSFLQKFNFQSTTLAAQLSMEHHEWWNGTGYPRQLKLENISMASRIVALADTVGALFNRRPGRDNWDFVRILKYVETRKSLQFDPAVVDVFMQNKAKIYHILCSKRGNFV